MVFWMVLARSLKIKSMKSSADARPERASSPTMPIAAAVMHALIELVFQFHARSCSSWDKTIASYWVSVDCAAFAYRPAQSSELPKVRAEFGAPQVWQHRRLMP